MLEIENLEGFFLCNEGPICRGADMCQEDCFHTNKTIYAKNEDSVRLFNEFKERFVLLYMEDGTMFASEREK